MGESLRHKSLKSIDLPSDHQVLIIFEWKDGTIDSVYATKYRDNGPYMWIETADGNQRYLVYYQLRQVEIIKGRSFQYRA